MYFFLAKIIEWFPVFFLATLPYRQTFYKYPPGIDNSCPVHHLFSIYFVLALCRVWSNQRLCSGSRRRFKQRYCHSHANSRLHGSRSICNRNRCHTELPTSPNKGVTEKIAGIRGQGHAIFSSNLYTLRKTAPDMVLSRGGEGAADHRASRDRETRTYHALGTLSTKS